MFNTMSAYLDSNKIKVFPCGGRNINYDPLARLTTEQNLISIINRLVDMDSFIVTTHASNQEMDSSTEEYIFNIDGYLFTVPNGVGAKDIIKTALDDYFTTNKITNLTEGTAYYLLAHIRKEMYQGVNSDGVSMTYIQLSPVSKTYPDPITSSYIEINIPEGATLQELVEVPGVYKYGNQYVKKEGNIYYECDSKGNYILSSEYYRNDILDQEISDDKALFNGLEFIITTDIYTDTAVDKYLTLFEYRWDARKWYEYEDSKVKFKTLNSGSRRSVTIDDGVLS